MTHAAGHAVKEHMTVQSCNLAYFDVECAHFGINAMTALPTDAPGVAVHLDTRPDSRRRHWKNCQYHPRRMRKLGIEAHDLALFITYPLQDLICPLCCQLL